MKKGLAVFCFLLWILAVSATSGEASVTLDPASPRIGDYVEVTVRPDRENPREVSYALFYGEDKVFSGKGVQHYDAFFRPRKEGTYTLTVTVSYGKDDKEVFEIDVPVSGEAPAQEGPEVVYSQKDGWWKKKKYASSELQTAGCAIFTISHALQRMGYSGEEITPEKLAKTYVYYRDGEGTWNEGLVSYVGRDYDYLTQKELLKNTKEIAAALRSGDYFSFSIVDRHIALADGISPDGTKVHIVDSAPGATFERIRNKEAIFVLQEDGTFTQAAVPEDLPGIRWFFETQEYGGMEYWMDLEYCANRGMRLIRSPWLKAETENGLKGVSLEYTGALMSKVTLDGKSWRVPTRELTVISGGKSGPPQLALVTAKKGTTLKDADGKTIAGKQKIPRQTMVILLSCDGESLYAWWDDAYGYLTPGDVTILPAAETNFATGIIAQNGNTNGGSQVTVHLNPDKKSTGLAIWKTGTPVAVAEKQGSYYLMEGKGLRGWVHEKYFLPDQPEETNPTEGSLEYGQKVNEGE